MSRRWATAYSHAIGGPSLGFGTPESAGGVREHVLRHILGVRVAARAMAHVSIDLAVVPTKIPRGRFGCLVHYLLLRHRRRNVTTVALARAAARSLPPRRCSNSFPEPPSEYGAGGI